MTTTFQPNIRILASREEVICANQQCKKSVNPVAKQLHRTAQDVYEFFSEHFRIDGVNGKGEVPPFIIGWDQQNAAWTCSMVGENKRCFLKFHNDFAIQEEVVAHEYTHAMLSRLTKLGTFGEAGALHESISDVMAIAFKHMKTEVQDWQIVDRDLSDHVTMTAFKKPYPRSPDQGHVHHNSQIPSHAFFEAVMRIKGVSYGVMAGIWMQAALEVSPKETFKGFALKTVQKASLLPFPSLKLAVAQSWVDVGVLKVPIRRNPVKTERQQRPQALRFMSIRG